MRWLAALVLVLAVGLLLWSSVEIRLPARHTADPQAIERLPARGDLNLVFLVVDTLRADHLGAYGYARDTSPTLDRLAETGVRFARHVAQSSWTKTSMASLWTGTYPVSHGILRYSHALPEQVRMPAEMLGDAGYRTGGLYRNGWVGPEFGFSQGFDLYLKPAPMAGELPVARPFIETARSLSGSDWDLTQSAIEFVRRNAHQRFFLYAHYMDVHQYAAERSSALFGSRYEDAYDNAIHWTDRNVGALVEAIEGLGLMERTLIVIASDHGEAFNEHGFEGHGRDLHAEVIETPLIVVLPFFLKPGIVVEEVTENVDVWPTILDLLGLPPLEGAQGRSLVPLMLGGSDPHPGPAFAHLERRWAKDDGEDPTVAVTDGSDRLIHWKNRGAATALFDLAADPHEQESLASRRPCLVERLLREVDRYYGWSSPAWDAPPSSVEVDEMKLGILKALGYVVGNDGEARRRGARERAPSPGSD